MHIFDNIFESILYMVFYDLTHDFYIQTLHTHLSYAAINTQSYSAVLSYSMPFHFSLLPVCLIPYLRLPGEW